MLNYQSLITIMKELLELKEIGCTYDFKERFSVGLEPLEILGFTKVIRTRIPACGDHCQRYKDCKWIPHFESRKSVAKFKLTKEGLSFSNKLILHELDDENAKSFVQDEIQSLSIIDTIMSYQMDSKELSIEKLVTKLLNDTNITLSKLRITIMDILDLMVSLELIALKEGQILPFFPRE